MARSWYYFYVSKSEETKTIKYSSLERFIRNNKIFLAMLGLSFFSFSLWIMAFWPANMSPDSMTFWAQATSSKFDNLHPYLFSLFIKFLNIFWHSPVTLIVFQTLFFCSIVSYFFQYLLKRGASKSLVYPSFVALLLFVPIGLYNTTFWNDVIYTYLILLVSFLFVKNSFDAKEGKAISTATLVTLIALVTAIAAFRYNGIVYLFIIPVIYYIYKLLNIRKAFMFLVAVLFLFGLQALPIKSLLKVSDNSKLLPEIPKAKVIGSAMKAGTVFDQADEQFLLAVAPKKVWDNYVCQNDYTLFWDNQFDKDFLESNKQRWNQIFVSTVIKHPGSLVKDRVCLAANSLAGQNMYFLGISNNQENLSTAPKSSWLHNLFTKIVNWTGRKPQRFLVWSPAIFVFGFLVAAYAAVRRKLYISLGYIFINVANIGLILLITTSAEYRYLYSVIPALFFVPALLSLEMRLRKTKES